MSTLTQELIQFVTSLPPSINPYEATAKKVIQETEMAKPILWGRILRRIIAFLFFTLFCQATAALILRRKANKLKFFRYNKLGLIHVEVLNEMVLLMLFFSLLAFIDLVTQEFAEKKLIRFSSKIVLHTCKFPLAAIVCWFIETTLNLTSLGARARSGASIKLSPLVRFALNGLLVTVMVVPGALLLWMSTLAALNIRVIETTTRKIVADLLQNAPSYRPETYNYSSVLQILKPSETVLHSSTLLNSNLNHMLLLYLIQHSAIAALYLPTWIFVLRGLRKKKTPEETPKQGSLQICNSSHPVTIDKVRKRLIKHAFLIYLQEILYCPPLVYMLSAPTAKVSHFNDPTWVLVEQVAIHGPTALIGNIILAFLIQNSLYTTQKSTDFCIVEANACQDLVLEAGKADETVKSLEISI